MSVSGQDRAVEYAFSNLLHLQSPTHRSLLDEVEGVLLAHLVFVDEDPLRSIEQFAQFAKLESEKYLQIIKESGVKPE